MEYINFEHNETAAELVRAAYDTPPLAFVHSYGCQQNVNDGERIKGVLVDIGYGLCDKPEDADLILFNTCAVREHAEQRVFGNVGALKGLKEKKRGLMIGLCGCMANQKHELRGRSVWALDRQGRMKDNKHLPSPLFCGAERRCPSWLERAESRLLGTGKLSMIILWRINMRRASSWRGQKSNPFGWGMST